MAPNKLMLVFDGTCGFCTRSVLWVKSIDRKNRVETIPFQDTDRRESLGLTLAECKAAAWTVHSDGTKHRGPAAVFDAIGLATGLRWLVRLAYLPLASSVMNLGYEWLARNRHRLPGHVPHCQEHPEDC